MKRRMGMLGILVIGCAAAAMAQPPGGPGRQGGRGGPPGGGPPRSPVIEALDADHDGVISAEELKNASAALTTLDKNNDGKLTEDEYRPQGGGGRGPDGPLGGAPGHGPTDGSAGRPGSEGGPGRGPSGPGMGPSPERMLAHAMEFDADKDGMLSKTELQNFFEDFTKRHSGRSRPAGIGDPPGGDAAGRSNGPQGDRPSNEDERRE